MPGHRGASTLVVAAGCALGCSSAAEPAPEAPREATPHVISAAPAPRVEREGDCRIVAPQASVTVLVPIGDEPLAVEVERARLTAFPVEGGALVARVEAALELEGRIEGAELFPVSVVTVANGLVELGPMSILQSTSVVGAELVAKTVDVGPGFQLSALRVPCDVITFVGAGHPAEEAHRGSKGPSLRSFGCESTCASYTTPAALDFHERPGEGATVRLSGSTVVTELEGRGAWARVSTQDLVHMDGAQITGWVRRDLLTKIEGGFGFTGGRSFASPVGKGRTVRVAKGDAVYQGPARIDEDAPVYDSQRGGTVWAKVADATATFEVIVREAEPRAEILSGPAFPSLQRAWVAAEFVNPAPRGGG